MKTLSLTIVAVLLTLGAVAATQPASAQAICRAQNNFGAVFVGTSPGLAIAACQLNTPIGGACFFQGC